MHSNHPTIGLLCRQMTDEYAEAVWIGADSTARKYDANLIYFAGGFLGSTDYTDGSNVAYDLASQSPIDGVVIWGAQLASLVGSEGIKALCSRFHPLPVVNIGLSLGLEGVTSLLVDNYQGMRNMVTHLIEAHRYTRIAFLHGPEANPEMEDRFLGYADALAEHDIPLNSVLVVSEQERRRMEWSEHVNYWEAGARILLDKRGLRPQVDFEAVVGYNDLVAIGTVELFQTRGIHVPGQVAVIGFDDIDRTRCLTPPLTTARQPFYELGQQATEILLDRLNGLETDEQVLLPMQIVVRQSCGCPDPVVEQAAIHMTEPRERGANIYTLTAGHETIVSVIAKAAGRSTQGIDPTWAGQLLDNLVAEASGLTSGRFLPVLENILRQVMTSGGEIAVWQEVISSLRRQVHPCLDDCQLATAENLWQQTRVLIGQMIQRAETYRAWRAEQKLYEVHRLGQILSGAYNLDEMMDNLANGLAWLQIPSAYVSLYENPVNPTEWAWLVMAYNEHGRISLETGGLRFPSSQLVPEGMLPGGRPFSLIVQPLYFQQTEIGFAVLEAGPRDKGVYDALRADLSGAIHSALLLNAEKRPEKTPGKKPPIPTEQTAPPTDNWLGMGVVLHKLVPLWAFHKVVPR